LPKSSPKPLNPKPSPALLSFPSCDRPRQLPPFPAQPRAGPTGLRHPATARPRPASASWPARPFPPLPHSPGTRDPPPLRPSAPLWPSTPAAHAPRAPASHPATLYSLSLCSRAHASASPPSSRNGRARHAAFPGEISHARRARQGRRRPIRRVPGPPPNPTSPPPPPEPPNPSAASPLRHATPLRRRGPKAPPRPRHRDSPQKLRLGARFALGLAAPTAVRACANFGHRSAAAVRALSAEFSRHQHFSGPPDPVQPPQLNYASCRREEKLGGARRHPLHQALTVRRRPTPPPPPCSAVIARDRALGEPHSFFLSLLS